MAISYVHIFAFQLLVESSFGLCISYLTIFLVNFKLKVIALHFST